MIVIVPEAQNEHGTAERTEWTQLLRVRDVDTTGGKVEGLGDDEGNKCRASNFRTPLPHVISPWVPSESPAPLQVDLKS